MLISQQTVDSNAYMLHNVLKIIFAFLHVRFFFFIKQKQFLFLLKSRNVYLKKNKKKTSTQKIYIKKDVPTIVCVRACI